MQPSPTVSEPLELLCALNCLFLGFLQRCALAGRAPLDLPRGVERALARASCEQLESIAKIPRALFRLRLASCDEPVAVAALGTPLDQMQHSLRLTTLVTVWNTVRESEYRARLFYGLDPATLQCLRTASLRLLPNLAATPDLLRCVFADAEPFWRSLLSPCASGLAPELRLLALQPDIRTAIPAPAGPPRLAAI
jgi:hypothetical protein